MDLLKNLPREAQVILGAAVLALIFSFFDWQQVSFLNVTAGRSEWNGIGVVAGLLIIAVLLWEAARALNIELGSVPVGLVSVVLALALLLFTVITFLTHNEARHWPSWIGLILSIVIAAVALMRGRAEGVQMPDFSAMANRGGPSGPSSTPPSPPPSGDA
jgi:drug/metabolite transporter (DMT)-like permease